MNATSVNINEQKAAEAFSKQSLVFDKIYSTDTIIQYKRERVRQHLAALLQSGNHILELNAGTGEDALWFAQQGHFVHATDISAGMLEKLSEKVKQEGLQDKITTEQCSFTQLNELKEKNLFDCVFSNFAGLNCTGELDKVLHSFASVVKPGGIVTLVILPKFCLWETLLLLKGKFKTAFRRSFSKNGRTAQVEGVEFKCWYYDPSFVVKHLKDSFDLISVEGLCTIVPPSYMKGFAEKHPSLYRSLVKKEDRLKTKWPWRSVGDYYIISFRKRN